MAVAQQLSLLDAGAAPAFDATFADAVRVDLGRGAWIERVPAWLRGHDALFASLERAMSWRSERRTMYEREVDVPRLFARVPDDGPGHPLLPAMARALGARFHAPLDSTTLALYRDGEDSVAWHRDRGHRDRERSVVAVVSLGGARRFLLRPLGGGSALPLRSLALGPGDLVVMGGASQRVVEHCVPKTAHALPRIALMFRHTAPIAPVVPELTPR
jgi:alkylated DNA repair dioxygenase AlkB